MEKTIIDPHESKLLIDIENARIMSKYEWKNVLTSKLFTYFRKISV